MKSFQPKSLGAAGGVAATEIELWLIGQPPLHRYLDYVEENVVAGAALSRPDVVDVWRTANDHYATLEVSEGGFPDQSELRDCAPSLTPRVAAIKRDARYRRAFDTVPTRVAVVELDRLIVSQPHINLAHVARLKTQLRPDLSEEEVFEFCFPINQSPPPVHARRIGSHRYLFWSPSSDFRFQEAALVEPEAGFSKNALGPIGGVLGISVGFGPNFLSAIQFERRLILDNGHHRAYALRELGFTHAPCIVETVSRGDELSVVASEEICDNPGFYFKAPRPPVLKDFFNPNVSQRLHIRKCFKIVEVSFEVRKFEVSDHPIAVSRDP